MEISKRVTLRELASMQGVSVPAVSRMMLRMMRQRMVERNGACGIALTPSGLEHAASQARRQRIIEVYFVRELGYAWSEVFDPARRFGETADEDMVERMYDLTGRPTACPHGSPISPTGAAALVAHPPTLAESPEGMRGTVASVLSHDARMLRYLEACGLRPGAPIEIGERAPFGDIVHVRTANGDHALGNTIARLVTVADSTQQKVDISHGAVA
jgi:DtxR family Mn-dependent transcriptional regulator